MQPFRAVSATNAMPQPARAKGKKKQKASAKGSVGKKKPAAKKTRKG